MAAGIAVKWGISGNVWRSEKTIEVDVDSRWIIWLQAEWKASVVRKLRHFAVSYNANIDSVPYPTACQIFTGVFLSVIKMPESFSIGNI
jgi:hypothetical protein